MKKIVSLLLFLVLICSLGGGAFAEEYDGFVAPASVLLLDPDSGETLYEKDPDLRVYPASTTKILTTLVVLEQTEDLQSIVTVNGQSVSGITEGDDSTLEPMLKDGEQLTVEQLLYGLMLVSGNDCAAVLADYVAGGRDAFVALMNEKAASLGMTESHFQNPHGVQDENHYTTARDMAKLAKAAMDTPAFMQIVSTPTYRIPPTNLQEERLLETSNRFLAEKDDMPGTACPWVTGIKTGYTPTAGGCLVTSAEKDGRRLLCLIYGDSSEEQRDRWFLTKDLLSFTFGEDTTEAAAVETEESADTADETGKVSKKNPKEAPEKAKDPVTAGNKAPSVFLRVLWTFLGIVLGFIAFVILLLTLIRIYNTKHHARHRVSKRSIRRGAAPAVILALVLLIPMGICFRKAAGLGEEIQLQKESQDFRQEEISGEGEMTGEETAEEIRPVFDPAFKESSDPSRWGVTGEVITAGQVGSEYVRENRISFGAGENYFALPGVATFRGNNYRNGGSYGTANIQQGSISTIWSQGTGSLSTSTGGYWTGSGWTGQPLIAKWDGESRSVMNLYDSKKGKEDLVEVIYATLDGHIYFLDLADGSYTRDPIDLGMPFKGAGALDPRGYPLMYVGAGDGTPDGRKARMFVVSLINGSILYEYGSDDSYALRMDNGSWVAYDSSPLVDAETDTLIWPGENGILYTIHLNTSYDKAAGTISVAPDEPVRFRYRTARSGEEKYWYGMEASAVIVDRCLYISENGGMFFCIDLDTMNLLWAQDTKDDSNSTPVYEPDGEGHGFIYTAPSLHWTAKEDMSGTISIYKLDAISGEVVWSRSYKCWTVDGVSGGVQSSPVLGREGSSIDGMVFYGISRTPDMSNGLLVALDTRTGSEVWRLPMTDYAWSSPLALYDSAGRAWLVLCDSAGRANLIDGATGQLLTSISLGSLVEATPAAFDSTLVVGTRGQQILGLSVY